MAGLKAGSRMQSAVCTTEVMVVKAPEDDCDIRCGGAAMLEIGAEKSGAAPDAGAAGGTQVGKRYVDAADTLELLCTKPGAGSLAQGDAPLVLKETKPLPSSD